MQCAQGPAVLTLEARRVRTPTESHRNKFVSRWLLPLLTAFSIVQSAVDEWPTIRPHRLAIHVGLLPSGESFAVPL